MNIEADLATFSSWASAQPDIEGIAIVGSYARATASESSDIDLMILSTDCPRYLTNVDWLSLCGTVKHYTRETWGRVQTLRAVYSNGIEVEYNFCDPSWAAIPVDEGTHRVANDGLKILFDRKGKFAALQRAVSSDMSK